MSENSVGLLVKKAKGEDRTLREYARDSGVDVSIISKIISGRYVPKKTEVYKALTSTKASPRDGVTYKQIIEAANSSRLYQEGIVAGMSVAQTALLSVGGGLALGIGALPLTVGALGAGAITTALRAASQKGDITIPEEFENDYQRFIATANGLIFSALSLNGITFHIDDNKDANKENSNIIGTCLRIDNHNIKEYCFKYAFFSENQKEYEDSIEKISVAYIAELIFLEPNKNRMLSIVTNSRHAFDCMVSYKNRLSYDGNLSIILVDLKNVTIVKDEIVSYYHGGDTHASFPCLV